MAVRVVATPALKNLDLNSLNSGFNWGALGSTLQGAGALYGAYNQNKMANKLYKLQSSYLKKEEERKKRSQARLDYASSHYLGHRDDNARLPIQY